MINLARQKYPPNSHPNLSFQVMDANNLAFDGCFDLVFSNAMLHWVKHHPPVIEALYESLRLGGKILLRRVGKGDAAGMLAVIDCIKDSNRWLRYFAGFEFPYTFPGVDDYQALLKTVGFSIHRLELVP